MRWKWILGIAAFLIVALTMMVYVILPWYDYNNLNPTIARVVKVATGREPIPWGNIDLRADLTPALVVEDISFQNAPSGSWSELAKIRGFVRVALLPLIRASIDIKRLILVEPDMLVETAISSKSNLKLKTRKKTAPEEERAAKRKPKLPALAFSEVRIEKGRLTYKDERLDRTYAVKLDNLTAKAAAIDSPVEFELKASYNDVPFEVSGTFGPLKALNAPDRALLLNLTAKGVGATLTVKGVINDMLSQRGIELSFRAHGKDLVNLGQLAKRSLPLKGTFDISGRIVDSGPKTYNVSNLKVALGDSHLSGSVEMSLLGNRPHIRAVLSSEKLNLRPVLSASAITGTGERVKAGKKRNKVFSNDPFRLNFLEEADADIKIRAAQLLLPKVAINDLAMDMILQEGRLMVKLVKAVIAGGIMDGHFDLTPHGKAAVLLAGVRIEQIDLGRMLKDLEVTEVLEGKLDVAIDLKARGNSVAALMAGLDGYTSVVMSEGRIDNKYIDLLGADTSSSLFRLLNPYRKKANHTEINCFVSRFDIKDGLAKSTVLVFDTNRMSVVGDGELNLKNEKLNLSLKPVPKKGFNINGIGTLRLSLSELTRPFKLGGTLADPSLAINPMQTAITLGKAVGGVVLFGPVGIAAGLLSGSSGDENPCLTAIEAAKKGAKFSEGEEPEEKKGAAKRRP